MKTFDIICTVHLTKAYFYFTNKWKLIQFDK
jgi:hypothetical protein